jgi:hypothetical protein
MAVWETNPAIAEQSHLTADSASAWQAADNVVYSITLTAVPTATTRLEHHFDPDPVRELKAETTSDLTIGGANLAARAFEVGLVDECQLFVWPMILGVASQPSQRACPPTSSSLTSTDSATASCTSATASRPDPSGRRSAGGAHWPPLEPADVYPRSVTKARSAVTPEVPWIPVEHRANVAGHDASA